MMDIVERLRKRAATWVSVGWGNNDIFDEAANTIERLREQAHYHYEHGLKKDVEIENLREEIEYLKAHTIHDQYKAESEGEERGYRMGYEDGLADGKGG